jgi:gluconate 2-dehydrogenase gamma chain
MPNQKTRLHRRTFLGAGVAAAAAGAALSCSRNGAGPYWRFFTAEEARTVDAICERLIPADRDPGASQAGVVHYIDIQLTRVFRKHRNAYRQGIAAVDAASRKTFGGRFAELAPPQQAQVLEVLEHNSRAFFQLILTHAQQGFYGDPRHGGNRRMASWKMLGLPFPPVRGRQHYDEPPKEG